MSESEKKIRIGWLSSHLSRKTMMAIVLVAVLSGLAMYWYFLTSLGRYAGDTYENLISEASVQVQKVGSVLQESGGNLDELKNYVSEQQIGCDVHNETGSLLFEYLPFEQDNSVSASSSTKIRLADGRQLTVRAWSRPIQENELIRSFMKSALLGMLILNLLIFLIVAVLMYLLVLSPVIGLRKTMKSYYESGTAPEPSVRRDEIGRLHNTFVKMVGVLKTKEQTERRLVASVSHDIKTPLTSVMGYSERLLSAQLSPEKQAQYLQNIYDKALVIKTVVDEFDEYLEVGFREDTPMFLMRLGDFCEAIRSDYQEELSDAGVELTVDCSCPNQQIRCNYDHMRRVFGNLVSNSIQHADAKLLQLHFTCVREDDQIVLSLCDNGQGVQPELLSQIFEPFFTTDRGRKVSGLGLAICKNIVCSHGGTIQAENLPSGGLLVQIRLPRCIRPDGSD